jgi:1,4-alpha-glucan branching enzyme
MNKIYVFLLLLTNYTFFAQVTTNPSPIEVDQSVTITVDTNSTATDCNGLNGVSKVYIHTGIGDDSSAWDFEVIGNWGQDDGVGEMTNNGDGTFSITFVPKNYYGLTNTQASSATKMGMVFRSADGTKELKADGCSDFILNVGAFQLNTIVPDNQLDYEVLLSNATQIMAQNTNGNADYTLIANGVTVNTSNNTSFYSYFYSGITENKFCELKATQGENSISKFFTIIADPNKTPSAVPSGMEDGINYHSGDPSKVTLVLDAKNKDYIYVAGSFNDWKPNNDYAMTKDPNSDKFWIELSGLTSGQIETFQYWVAATAPVTGSPKLVKTADPYSTLVLSPYDDSYIPETSYSNIPDFPEGPEREVSVIQTGKTPYNWQVTNFQKPDKEDLVIYELLIRDFDADRNYQSVIDRIDYFKELNINAIQLMPIMEYEGNESWGYNTAYHMALDKYYGTEDKFKELVDLCHQNGIAVILDLALNHAFGRNPLVRMWMDDTDKNGWGEPSSENPYLNEIAKHSYSVGSDFNHSSSKTQYYTQRVVKHWIEEFKIDGFRWDLTKGFTQNCENNEGCTNSYQQDRVDILKSYADYSWSLDDSHYVIFEHLGSENEEKEWANYRLNEGKGVMMWGKTTQQFNQLSMGWSQNSSISWVGHKSRSSFQGMRLLGYAESHDEERLLYNNSINGNASSGYDTKDLNTSLERMNAIGAVLLSVPGPKMIWHFSELGMNQSLFTCNNGTVGDCKLDTKPQPQWSENWPENSNRAKIYNNWSRLIELKTNFEVFKGDYDINQSDPLLPRIAVWNNALGANDLKNVIVIANFELSAQTINPFFTSTGVWYDLMDSSGETTLPGTTSSITLQPGTFRIFGDQNATLGASFNELKNAIKMYPNPSSDQITFNHDISHLNILDLSGKLVLKKTNLTKLKPVNIADLKIGIYIVTIENNNTSQSIKLIKK